MPDELVALCQCWDLAEAQSIRASLAARGVRVLIDGEHQRGVLGMMGAAISLRVMVPRSQLSLARELAAEIIPDLGRDAELDAEEELLAQPSSPARRSLPELDETDDDDDDDDDDEGERGEPPRKKSLAVALVIGGLGLAIGTLHMYVGERRTGIALLGLAGVALVLMMAGMPWGRPLLLAVWALDVGRGVTLIWRHNAAIDEADRKARLMRLN